MTSKGPFQPKAFYDSMICVILAKTKNEHNGQIMLIILLHLDLFISVCEQAVFAVKTLITII